ncbi:MAG: CBS domain-containing protein [Limisphaerales bacterium]
MLTRFRTLNASDTLDTAIRELLAGSQQDFPIVENGNLVGVLRRNDLVRGLAQGGRERPIGEVLRSGCRRLHPEEPLERAFEVLREDGCQTLPVLSNGQLVGLLTLENVTELMMVNTALGEGSYRRDAELAAVHDGR